MRNSEEIESGRGGRSKDPYRDFLVNGEQKAQDLYDKTLLALTSAGLGFSLACIKNIIPQGYPAQVKGLLVASWGCWAVALLFLLLSYFTSNKAHARARAELDKRTLDPNNPGGRSNKATKFLNVADLILFSLGLLFLLAFVAVNFVRGR